MNESRIAQLRRAHGWTQERLAEESHVAVRTIQRLEAGLDANMGTLSMIAAALEVPVGELFASVEHDDFEQSVRGLQDRQAEQQERRDATVRAWRKAYSGLGVLVTLLVLALVGSGTLPDLGIFIVPAYWVGAKAIYTLLLRLVLDPRLDEQYPLSKPAPSPRRFSRS